MVPDRDTVLRGIGAIALICLVGGAFVFSYVRALHDPKPEDVPIGTAGPASLGREVDAGGSFEARPVADEAAAALEIDEGRRLPGRDVPRADLHHQAQPCCEPSGGSRRPSPCRRRSG